MNEQLGSISGISDIIKLLSIIDVDKLKKIIDAIEVDEKDQVVVNLKVILSNKDKS